MISASNTTPLSTHNSKGNRNTSRNIKYLFHTNVCNFSNQLNIERLNKLHANSISGVEVVPCIILKISLNIILHAWTLNTVITCKLL